MWVYCVSTASATLTQRFLVLACHVQVARYSALVGGIGYGIIHRRTLQKRADTKASIAEKKHQEKLLEDKRREQDQSILAAVRAGGSGGGEWGAEWAG